MFGGDGGGEVTVRWGKHGAGLVEVFGGPVTLDLEADAGQEVGFGTGAAGDYAFRDVYYRTDTDTEETVVVTYAYDALGRRVARTVDPDGTPETTYFHYDGPRVVEERDGTGALAASYVYGLYVDEVLQMRRGADDYFFHADDHYNVFALTDDTGAVIERYDYGDFGLPEFYAPDGTPRTESAFQNPYLFTGRRWDAELVLYYYRARHMDPAAGRFLSRDPLGLWGDPMNLGVGSAYAGGNPWTYGDAWGLEGYVMPESWLGQTWYITTEFAKGAIAGPFTSAKFIGGKTGGAFRYTFELFLPENHFKNIRAIRPQDPNMVLAPDYTHTTLNDPQLRLDDALSQLRELGTSGFVATAETGRDAAVAYGTGKTLGLAGGMLRKSDEVSKLIEDLFVGTNKGIVRTDREARVLFGSLEVRAVRDLSHLDENVLRAMEKHGFSGTDIHGRKLHLHHLDQNPRGPLVEIPSVQHNISNPVQHPLGNAPGAGLTATERAAFDEWRERYWKARAVEELSRRGLYP